MLFLSFQVLGFFCPFNIFSFSVFADHWHSIAFGKVGNDVSFCQHAMSTHMGLRLPKNCSRNRLNDMICVLHVKTPYVSDFKFEMQPDWDRIEPLITEHKTVDLQ